MPDDLSPDCDEALHVRCQRSGDPCQCACHNADTLNHPRGCQCSEDCRVLADEDRARVAERAESWWV